tara:strand:- start:295 stop:654 length:360 start_codon:yes stop_codon:yes gene_type:complete
MANKQKGESDLRVGGKVYTLRYSTNALCVLEDAFDDTVQNIAKRFENTSNGVRMSDVRMFFHAALTDNHPDIDLAAAGLIISDAGIDVAMASASEAFQLAFAPSVAGAETPKGKRKTLG